MTTGDPIRVLLIEDDHCDAMLVERALQKSFGTYTRDRVNTLSEGIEKAAAGEYQVILTDLDLPDADGLESVSQLHLAANDTAIIVTSGSEDEQLCVDALTMGAIDFLKKSDINPVTLHRCIRQNVQRLRQQNEIKRLVQEVHSQKTILENQAVELSQKNARLSQLCDTSQRFVSNVSHEFRTPLCVIKQYASLIADGIVGDVSGEQQRMLRVMEDRVDDLNNMVDDMLDASRHESGLLSASRLPCQAGDIVARILPGLQQRAKLRDIEIELRQDDDLPEIYCDSEKVARTLINLVTNAVKFSEPGQKVSVEISYRPCEGDVNFAVVDCGPGIAPEQRDAIFGRFTQANTSLLSSTKGFGLGLNIAKELVELNLGEMKLQSEVGEGARFEFTVPVNEVDVLVPRYLARANRNANGLPIEISVVNVRLSEQIRVDTSCESRQLTQRNVDIQNFLNFLTRSGDFVIGSGPNEWTLMLVGGADDASKMIERAEREAVSTNRNRPQGPLPAMRFQTLGSFMAGKHHAMPAKLSSWTRQSFAATTRTMVTISRSIEAVLDG